jgi:hypothetical protein
MKMGFWKQIGHFGFKGINYLFTHVSNLSPTQRKVPGQL